MVTHKHPQISYVISKISACCNTKNRKNGNTDHKKEGNLPPNQNFKRKNGNTH